MTHQIPYSNHWLNSPQATVLPFLASETPAGQVINSKHAEWRGWLFTYIKSHYMPPPPAPSSLLTSAGFSSWYDQQGEGHVTDGENRRSSCGLARLMELWKNTISSTVEWVKFIFIQFCVEIIYFYTILHVITFPLYKYVSKGPLCNISNGFMSIKYRHEKLHAWF